MSSIIEILNHCGSDKARNHSYGPIYEEMFAKFRDSAKAILEIGVYQGSSIRAWHAYFSNATIVSVDIKPHQKCTLPPNRSMFFNINATSINDISKVINSHGPFDIIVDDGSHDPKEQQTACNILLKHVRPGGLYIIEDVRTVEIAYSLACSHKGAVVDLRAIKGLRDDILVIFRIPEKK